MMRAMSALFVALIAAVLIGVPLQAAAQYEVGDLYLFSHAFPTINYGVTRIDPISGAASTHYDIPDSPTPSTPFAYDPFRDRLLYGVIGGGLPTGIQTIDSAGNMATIVPGIFLPSRMAARGDGLLYLWYSGSSSFQYLDGADTVHDLLNEAGTGPQIFPSGGIDVMLYHASTNSLIMLTADTLPPCAAVSDVCVVKMPLTPSGTQVGGPIDFAVVNISTAAERVVGIGYGPGDTIWFAVDTNDNGLEPRLQLVDPATMAISTFAHTGGFTGGAVISTGTYSNVSNLGFAFDTFNNVLRAYTLGASGAGFPFTTGLSAGGHSEFARMVEIWSAGPAPVPALGASGRAVLVFALALAPVCYWAWRSRSTT